MEILQSPQNGLKVTSVIRLSKLATLDKELVMGKLGVLDKLAIQELNQKLAKLFRLKDHLISD